MKTKSITIETKGHTIILQKSETRWVGEIGQQIVQIVFENGSCKPNRQSIVFYVDQVVRGSSYCFSSLATGNFIVSLCRIFASTVVWRLQFLRVFNTNTVNEYGIE